MNYAMDDHVFEGDVEVLELLDYLGMNEPDLISLRRRHIDCLAELFDDAQMTPEARRAWLRQHRWMTSFPTALAAAFGVDLVSVPGGEQT